MKRKLTRQILNEKRTNSWLVIELLIISVVVWYLVNAFMTPTRIQHLPNGYDMSGTVAITYRSFPGKVKALPEDSAGRVNTRLGHLAALINNIKSRPGVEEVAVGARIMPYNYNAWNTALSDPGNPDSTISSRLNMRFGTPETPRVMKLQPLAGAETVDDLVSILQRGQLIITRSVGRNLAGLDENDWYGDGLKGAVQFLGKEVRLNGRIFTVGAVVEDMRRGEYEPAFGSALVPIQMNSPEALDQQDIIVRVRPGMVADFVNDFKEHAAEFYRTELYYVIECKPVDEIKASHHLQQTIEKRNNVIIIIFLLVTIFLGLLGTFWFRTNQRISEIAIRMSAGARRSDIFRRLISEGLVMLVVASVPAAVIDWYIFAKVNDDEWPFYNSLFAGGSWGHLALCFGITFILMAVMVVVGIAFPARRAMKIDPAMALHAE